MPAIVASAPGKVILFGEHAVVYGQPALAAPLFGVQARATVTPEIGAPQGQVTIDAPDIGLRARLQDLKAGHPIVLLFSALSQALQITRFPALRLKITSTIPIASGFGSGAAVSVACVQAVSAFVGRRLSPQQASAIAFEAEKAYHGHPSGIDNTVIAYRRLVAFQTGSPPSLLRPGAPIALLAANSGIPSPTAQMVAGVRARWQAEPEKYDRLFEAIGRLSQEAAQNIEKGQVEKLGPAMQANHSLLQQMSVSCPALDRLVTAAVSAGALGAKLTGGGGGGNMIALVTPESRLTVQEALFAAGATQVLYTLIEVS